MSLREPLKPARAEPASSVHAPLAVSDACLATFSLPFAPQVHHTAPPALPRSAALASYGTARRQPRPRRLAPWARGAALGAGRGRRPGAAGDLLRELAVWTRLAELLGAVAAGAPPRRGGWELPGSRCPAQVLLRCCRSRAGWRTAPATTASRRRSRRRTLPAPLGRQQVRLPRDLGYTTGVLGRLQSHRCCSTGVPLQSARGPAAARSHRGAGAQDAEQAQQAGRRIWRLLARPLRQGWLFGRRHQLPWQLRHLLPRCTRRSVTR